jgi:tetratricopeptide (TPR) repeat protein
MIKKIVLGFVTYCLLLMAFSALTVEVNAQKKVPKKARNLKKAGDALFNKRDYQQAINKYAEAIIIADNYPDAHFWKGYSHYNLYQIKASQNDAGQQSELTLALDELNAAYRQGYTPLDIYKVRWYVNYLKQNYDAALEDLQNGMRLDPENLTFQSGLADVYYGKKSYREAVDAYVKVVDQIPNNGNAYYNIANANYNLGNTDAQKVAAQKAIANGTQFVGESYFLIGDAFQKERNLSAAAEAYEKSLNTINNVKELYQKLSDVYRTLNKYEDAIEITKKGLQAFPNDGDLYVDLSWYYSLADQHERAIGAAQSAIAFVPNNFMAYTNLCRGYNDLKNYNLAIAACNKAMEFNPGDGETNYYLGRAYAGLKNTTKAAEFYKKSIPGLIKYTQDRPYYADSFYLLGNAYYEDNQNDKAIESYEKSLSLSPKFKKALFNLGVAYFVGKNMPKAKEQYSKLLQLDPVEGKKLGDILGVK